MPKYMRRAPAKGDYIRIRCVRGRPFVSDHKPEYVGEIVEELSGCAGPIYGVRFPQLPNVTVDVPIRRVIPSTLADFVIQRERAIDAKA